MAQIKSKGKQLSKVVIALLILGVVVVGAGAFLFISANWDEIPNFGKFSLLLGLTLAAYFGGYHLKYLKKTYPKVGAALLFLGSILVGVTIFLTAQIFNITTIANHWLALLWFIAILPFAYAFDSKPILGLTIFTFLMWMFFFISESSLYGGVGDLYLLFGIAIYGIGQLHTLFQKYIRFKTTYQAVGLFFILFYYYQFTSSGGFLFIGALFRGGFAFQSLTILHYIMILFAVIGIGSISFSLIKLKAREAKHELAILLTAFIGFIVLNFILYLSSSFETFSQKLSIGINIVYTLVFFGLAIGSILVGYYKNLSSFVNLGLVFFALGIFTVYLSLAFRMLPTSLAMVGGGLLLIAIGWYFDKRRKELFKKMEK